MKNLHSLFVIPRYWPAVGGAELHTRELAHRLSLHHHVGVVHYASTETEQLEMAAAMSRHHHKRDGDMDVIQLAPVEIYSNLLKKLASHIPLHRSARKLYNTLFARSIASSFEKVAKNYDLIHSVYNGLTPLTEIALQTAKKQNKPFIWTPLVNTEEPDGTAWSSKAFRKLYPQADALITMTSYEKDFLVEMGAPKNKIHVCPASTLLEDKIDTSGFRNLTGVNENPFVLFLGRHVEDKGYRRLVDAAEKIWKQHPDIYFLFIGPGDEAADTFFNKINDKRIIRIKKISNHDKCSALAACEMLCVPSIKESLGVIYLEAWHYATPVIAADIPVLRTIIDHDKNGLLCQPNSISIAMAIEELIINPEKRQALGQAGKQKVDTQYSWDGIAQTMSGIYSDVINQQHFKKIYM